MRIYIVGYMFSGKSTIGRRLAKHLQFDFKDTDDLFEETYKISISDFFAKYGETAFRQVEHELLKKTAEMDNVVISTGGGMPCFFNNMEIIRSSGISIYLKQTPEFLYSRYQQSVRKASRPLLKDLSPEEVLDKIQQQLDERAPFYEQANIICMADTVNYDELQQLIEKIRN